MVKISCFEQWYKLSKPGVEEEIYDRSPFQEYLEIDLLDNFVSDDTTILNFRHFTLKPVKAEALPTDYFT